MEDNEKVYRTKRAWANPQIREIMVKKTEWIGSGDCDPPDPYNPTHKPPHQTTNHHHRGK